MLICCDFYKNQNVKRNIMCDNIIYVMSDYIS